ncbi:MAG: S1C family serine protease [Polaribacter sp.]
MKKFFGFLGMVLLGGAITLGGYKMLFNDPVIIEKTIQQPMQTVQANYKPTANTAVTNAISTDFTVAAQNSVNAVVHVKNTAIRTQQNPFDLFFGNGNGTRRYEQVGTGSGVIISTDGYIITNNHVIAGANALEITLNNRQKYKAEVIGADKNNDIALLKIDADIDLPSIPFANSDNIKIGEWVLAVGNPYNLTSTVTAGIVSAKGRDLEGNTSIDSFIQTDAAVNPGNSGGALVNTRGELVGINTAISSRTGSFIGYSFAVPSNIAKKIIDDLLEFGIVQEAIIGINIDNSAKNIEGVKIGAIDDESNAKKAGLREGDIIKKVNNVKISKFSELRGQLTAKRPGDFVDITVDRDGKLLTKKVKLSKRAKKLMSETLGWELKDLTQKELQRRNISNGVKIVRSNEKGTENRLDNYIVTKVDDKNVSNAEQAIELIDRYSRRGYPFLIELINLQGEKERLRVR